MFKDPDFQYFLRGRKNADCGPWRPKPRTPRSTVSQPPKAKTLEKALHDATSFTGNVTYISKKDASFIHFNISFLCVNFTLYRLRMALLRAETCSRLTYVVCSSLGLLTTNVLC